LIHHESCALEVSGLRVAYDGRSALDGIDLHLRYGDALALVGPNGAGKSTVLRSILGLAPQVGGDVIVLGTTAMQARPRVAYVPQAETLDAEFPVSVLQVALMGRYRQVGWFRRPSRADRALALAALEQVKMVDRAEERFGTLSGGQRQRVLLARAIAQEAKLLLLDEPFNGVDTTTQDLLVQVLADLRAGGAAVVLSTHDLTMAHLTCTDACLLNHVQFGFGPLQEVLTVDRLRAAYGSAAVVIAQDATTVITRS
jgi:manganese/iron transport system ATP-binding protein